MNVRLLNLELMRTMAKNPRRREGIERRRAQSKEIASRLYKKQARPGLPSAKPISKPSPAAVPSKPLVSELRAKLSASKDPVERSRIARRLSECRGTMLEIAATLPDLESVRKRIEQTKDPREKMILARYARNLRKNQPTKPNQK